MATAAGKPGRRYPRPVRAWLAPGTLLRHRVTLLGVGCLDATAHTVHTGRSRASHAPRLVPRHWLRHCSTRLCLVARARTAGAVPRHAQRLLAEQARRCARQRVAQRAQRYDRPAAHLSRKHKMHARIGLADSGTGPSGRALAQAPSGQANRQPTANCRTRGSALSLTPWCTPKPLTSPSYMIAVGRVAPARCRASRAGRTTAQEWGPPLQQRVWHSCAVLQLALCRSARSAGSRCEAHRSRCMPARCRA